MGPLAIHVKLVLMLPFRKINNGNKGVLTLKEDKREHLADRRVNTVLLFKFSELNFTGY